MLIVHCCYLQLRSQLSSLPSLSPIRSLLQAHPPTRKVPLPDWTVQARTLAGAGAFDEVSARAHAEAEVARTADVQCAMTNIAFVGHGPRWRGRLGDITAPTLVLHGEDDPFFPIGNGQALAAEIPDARLVRLGHAGHRPRPTPSRSSRRSSSHTRRADRATVGPRQVRTLIDPYVACCCAASGRGTDRTGRSGAGALRVLRLPDAEPVAMRVDEVRELDLAVVDERNSDGRAQLLGPVERCLARCRPGRRRLPSSSRPSPRYPRARPCRSQSCCTAPASTARRTSSRTTRRRMPARPARPGNRSRSSSRRLTWWPPFRR